MFLHAIILAYYYFSALQKISFCRPFHRHTFYRVGKILEANRNMSTVRLRKRKDAITPTPCVVKSRLESARFIN